TVADEVLAVRLEPRSPAVVVADVLVENDEVDWLEATFVREEIAEGLGRAPSQRGAEQAVVEVAAEHDGLLRGDGPRHRGVRPSLEQRDRLDSERALRIWHLEPPRPPNDRSRTLECLCAAETRVNPIPLGRQLSRFRTRPRRHRCVASSPEGRPPASRVIERAMGAV